ncbi:hypothetical protein NFI96_029743, partial [Prochilodus magdalenae]
LINWFVSAGCTLKGHGEKTPISAYPEESVLLPCYCTDPNTTPKRLLWKKLNTYQNTWDEISSESDQYRNRVQLVNDHSPGNLSLLISHLTEEDGGDYRCLVNSDGYRDIRLTVKGCTLKGHGEKTLISAYPEESVLLPCHCTDLNTTPKRLLWKKLNTYQNTWDEISSESGRYRNRVQLFRDHSPGNLSLLISHLTEADGGDYRCLVNSDGYRDIRLTVKGCTLKGHGEKTLINAYPEESVLLPCYCTDPNTTPKRLLWKKLNTYQNTWDEISMAPAPKPTPVSESTTHRKALVKPTPTVSSQKEALTFDMKSSVEVSTTTSSQKEPPQSLPFVPFALVTLIFLHIVVAVVYCTRRTKGTYYYMIRPVYSCYRCECTDR